MLECIDGTCSQSFWKTRCDYTVQLVCKCNVGTHSGTLLRNMDVVFDITNGLYQSYMVDITSRCCLDRGHLLTFPGNVVWTKVAWDTSPVDVVWTKVACSTSRADVALSSSVDSRGPKALPRNQGDGVDCFGMHNLMLGVL